MTLLSLVIPDLSILQFWYLPWLSFRSAILSYIEILPIAAGHLLVCNTSNIYVFLSYEMDFYSIKQKISIDMSFEKISSSLARFSYLQGKHLKQTNRTKPTH